MSLKIKVSTHTSNNVNWKSRLIEVLDYLIELNLHLGTHAVNLHRGQALISQRKLTRYGTHVYWVNWCKRGWATEDPRQNFGLASLLSDIAISESWDASSIILPGAGASRLPPAPLNSCAISDPKPPPEPNPVDDVYPRISREFPSRIITQILVRLSELQLFWLTLLLASF